MIPDKTTLINAINLTYLENKYKDVGNSKSLIEDTKHWYEKENVKKLTGRNVLYAMNIFKYLFKIYEDNELPSFRKFIADISLAVDNDSDFMAEIESHIIKPKEEEVVDLTNDFRNELYYFINVASYKNRLNKTLAKLKSMTKSELETDRLELIAELERIKFSSGKTDESITETIDSLDSIEEVLNKKEAENNKGYYVTGWKRLNKALQGGIRLGEFVLVPSLQHKYKTGMVLSIFVSIGLFNKPLVTEEGKNNVLLWISLEDSTSKQLAMMFTLIWKAKHNDSLEGSEALTPKEKGEYIINAFKENGWTLRMVKVDPTDWSYLGLYKLVEDMEKEGNIISLVAIDYLSLIPTTGCLGTGAIGTPVRELFRRVSNFFEKRDCPCLTPVQLDSRAADLLKQGVPDEEFLDYICEKNYYADSKQLGQDAKLEIHTHIVHKDGKYYLAVKRGKHKLDTIIDEKWKKFFLPFEDKTALGFDYYMDRDKGLSNLDNSSDSSW